jgi:hypothetical protein
MLSLFLGFTLWVVWCVAMPVPVAGMARSGAPEWR